MDNLTRLLRKLPPEAAAHLADFLEAVARALEERAELDRQRDASEAEMVAAMQAAELRRIAGPNFDRDRAVMKKVRAGWTNARIARHLGLSGSTVSRTISAIKADVGRR